MGELKPEDKSTDGKLVGAKGELFPRTTPLDQVPPVLPAVQTNDETILEVNGVACPVAIQARDMKIVADATGSKVVGLHNATAGNALDIWQSVLDRLGSVNNPATRSLAEVVLRRLHAEQPVHLMGHSQGCAIIHGALKETVRLLVPVLGKEEAERRLRALVKVETLASPVGNWPPGPRYRHYVNRRDPVAMCFQSPNRPNSEFEKTIWFTEPKDYHAIPTYLKRRQAF